MAGVVQQDWWDRIHADDKTILEDAFRAFYKGETERLHTLFRVSSNGDEPAWMESWAVASGRDEALHPTGIVGVIMDRTQSKSLEAKLIAGQRLESLGVLAGGIAHDFNNLLMTVTGSLDVVFDQYPEATDELRVIDRAAQQAKNLCDQLLTYAGRDSVELGPLDLTKVVNRFERLLTMSIDSHVRLTMDVADDCWINGESSQLGQVLMNLVKNASDAFSGEPGEITLRLRKVPYANDWPASFHLGADLKPGDFVSLEIEDTGSGMTSGEKEHLFDPFFTTKFTGRGLGMAVVLGVIRGHAGAIRVSSELGKGTTIQVVVPVETHRNEREAPVPSAGRPKLSGHALVVDDDPAVRETVRKMLLRLGLDVELAGSGTEALDRISASPQRFDVVLMDVTMPGMDGIETASRVLESHPGTRIILCSGYSNVAMPSKLTDSVGFLQKPYRIGQLRERITTLLREQN